MFFSFSHFIFFFFTHTHTHIYFTSLPPSFSFSLSFIRLSVCLLILCASDTLAVDVLCCTRIGSVFLYLFYSLCVSFCDWQWCFVAVYNRELLLLMLLSPLPFVVHKFYVCTADGMHYLEYIHTVHGGPFDIILFEAQQKAFFLLFLMDNGTNRTKPKIHSHIAYQ